MNKLNNQFIVQPDKVGSNKKSLAIIIPSKVVNSLDIDHSTTILLLRVANYDELQSNIIRQEHLEKKDAEKASAVANQ